MKQTNFALDIISLLPLIVKKKGHFDWLAETFRRRFVDDANSFAKAHPGTVKEWHALGVEIQIGKFAIPQGDIQNIQGETSKKRPEMGFVESRKKGSQAEKLLREQLDDLYY